ncbi:cholesterol esterase, partial [Streptomyces sp. NPDC059556]
MNRIPFSPRHVGPALARIRTTGTRAAVDWNARMLAEAADGTRRGTRWGRGALALVPSALAVGARGAA